MLIKPLKSVGEAIREVHAMNCIRVRRGSAERHKRNSLQVLVRRRFFTLVYQRVNEAL